MFCVFFQKRINVPFTNNRSIPIEVSFSNVGIDDAPLFWTSLFLLSPGYAAFSPLLFRLDECAFQHTSRRMLHAAVSVLIFFSAPSPGYLEDNGNQDRVSASIPKKIISQTWRVGNMYVFESQDNTESLSPAVTFLCRCANNFWTVSIFYFTVYSPKFNYHILMNLTRCLFLGRIFYAYRNTQQSNMLRQL